MMFGRTDWALGGIPLATISVEYLRTPAPAAMQTAVSLFDVHLLTISTANGAWFVTPPHAIALLTVVVLMVRAIAAAVLEAIECRARRARLRRVTERLERRLAHDRAP